MAEDCVFCGIVAGEAPSEMVDSDERTVSFMDINPATLGHALVIPRAHCVDLMDIEEADLEASIVAARRLARRMEEALGADGINILNAHRPAAWQTVFHFHFHVIPRYEDSSKDPLELPWVPTPGDREQIAAAAARLRDG